MSRTRRAVASKELARMADNPAFKPYDRVELETMAQDVEAVRRDPRRTGAQKDRAIKAILRRR